MILQLILVMMSLRQRLLQNGKSYGTLLMSDSPIVAEQMAGLGYSHIIVDHEHGVTDIRSGQAMLQAIAGAGSETEPIVRLPAHDTVYMKKVLDTLRLPGGVLVPMVEDVETADAVVQSTRYPRQQWQDESNQQPEGIRGCAVPFVRASGWGRYYQNNVDANSEEYMRKCQEDLLVMVQIETAKGMENIEAIAAVEGIDMIFIGPVDLSCSIGKMGSFQDQQVKELLEAAEQSVRVSSCLLGGFRPPGRDLSEMFGPAGYSLVTGSVDLGLLRSAARNDLLSAFEAGLESE